MAKEKLSKSNVSELISMFYRIETVIGSFGHVAHLQNVINIADVERERKRLEREIDKQ